MVLHYRAFDAIFVGRREMPGRRDAKIVVVPGSEQSCTFFQALEFGFGGKFGIFAFG
ncbi:MAG: hypothetical protein ACKV1O_08320 [Saprospiraceae bacterium]